MKLILVLISIVFLIPSFAQETVTVISLKANLRGTPDSKGIVVTTVNGGDEFELLKTKGSWYLIQTPVYVGWVHGNTIRLNSTYDEIITKPATAYPAVPSTPRPTYKPATGNTPFTETYVGSDRKPSITIKNNAGRTVTLVFGGVTYQILSGNTTELEVEEGNYEYFASAPGASPTSGVKTYKRGYAYSWVFYISSR